MKFMISIHIIDNSTVILKAKEMNYL